jgi:O-antigen ligase
MIRSIDAETSTDKGVFTGSFVILAGLTVIEIVRQGAFYRTDAFVVLVVSLGLISMCIRGTDSRSRLMIVAFVALGSWWYLSAVMHGRAASFLPLGASVVGFLASFLVVRRIGVAHREVAGELMATIGAGAAAVGLAASAMRWYPLAMPSQNLWRLATTLTYSDAAGLLLGVSLLVAVGLNLRKPLVRLDVSLCAAGVIATQSRGAVLALLVGGLLVPFGTLRRARWPLLAGLAAGLTLVGTSSGASRQPIAGVAVAALVVVGAVVRPSARLHLRTPRRALALAGAVIAVGGVVAVALHTPVQRRVGLASTSDRVSEWHAAFDQWRSSFWVGVGPDKVLHLNSAHGTYAFFAHDEFLQIAAGSGIVGVLLLLLALGAIAMTVRRTDTLSSCAAGAVVAFAVAALLDFDWHLAALGLVGGWAAALACPPDGIAVSEVPGSPGARAARWHRRGLSP